MVRWVARVVVLELDTAQADLWADSREPLKPFSFWKKSEREAFQKHQRESIRHLWCTFRCQSSPFMFSVFSYVPFTLVCFTSHMISQTKMFENKALQ